MTINSSDENDLIINSIGIKNYRSFDANGVFLKDLNKINLLIGKNNSGKSNVLKFLGLLHDLKTKNVPFQNILENQHHQSNVAPSIQSSFSFSELNLPEYLDDFSDRLDKYRKKISDYLNDDTTLEYKIDKEFQIHFSHNKAHDLSFEKEELFKYFIKHINVDYGGYRTPFDAVKLHYSLFYEELVNQVASQVIYIPDFRIIKEKSNVEKSNSAINGSNLISELSYMKNRDLGEDSKYEKLLKIEKKIAEILNVEKIEIQTPKKSERIVLVIDNKRWALDNFGTGVHDLVILCCMLMLNKKSLVCIEEPEIHLHPELQRRFIKFLLETDHQYLITTHSNVLVDVISNKTSVYHVKYDGTKSYINKSLTNNITKEIIDELGFKASDLLQTNGIIWVEGPSDRIFINAWLRLIDPEIKEGIHYSVMFYGGKLLSHVCFDNESEKDLVKLMKINSNSYVIIDRDKLPLNKTKARIKQEIGSENFWITQGIEIENYISLAAINKWLNQKGFKNLKKISLEEKFENSIISVKSSLKYDKQKAFYANEIACTFSVEDLDHLDLRKRINLLVRSIRQWNEKNLKNEIKTNASSP